MRTAEATRSQRRAAAVAFGALAGPALGLAVLAAWVLTQGLPICWPQTLGGRACALFLGAGLLCWLLAGTALATGAWQWARTTLGLAALLRRWYSLPDKRFGRLFRVLGLGGSVTVVPDKRLWAFTYGLACPRIAISTGLLTCLADDELAAVLLHEEHHRRCREPLRLILARTARAVLWFLPAAGRLFKAYAAAAELAADAGAMERVGRRPLAQALWKLRGADALAAAVPFAPGPGLLGRRVDQIERYPEGTLVSWPRWTDALATAAGVGAAAFWALLCLRT